MNGQISLLLLFAVACAGDPTAQPRRDGDWFEDVESRIAAEGRAIRDFGGAFGLTIPGVGLDARFNDDGIVFSDPGLGEDAIAIQLRGWGRAGRTVEAQSVEPELGACGSEEGVTGECQQRLEYARPGLVEWWQGTPEGVEQGWDVEVAPPGQGPLVFDVTIDGALNTRAGGAPRWTDGTGRQWMVTAPAAWDAEGEPLAVVIHLRGQTLSVEVDDTGAAYPITVDPVYTTDAWAWIGGAAYFGYSVAGGGDLNGDGYDDAVIGAPYAGTTGLVYVFDGSATGLSASASATLQGDPSVVGAFGTASDIVGDIDGDGYDDVVIGEPSDDRAFVYHGSSVGLMADASTTLEGTSGTDFGTSVAGADVNGDGYVDVVVGAYRMVTSTSAVYVYHGSASGVSSTASGTLNGATTAYDFGYSVASAGDSNGDGYEDLVVGAPSYSSSTGRAYVYNGSSTGISSSVSATLTGPAASSSFGKSVASAGDTNGDGYSDVVVGAPEYSTNTGRTYVYHGSAAGVSTTASATLVGYSTYNYFGYSVAGIGDVEGDGYDEVAVGAKGYSSSTGRVTVYSGSSAGTSSVASATLVPSAGSGLFGWSVSGAGDVDGDGHPDMLAGSPGYGLNYGAASLYAGSSSGISTTVLSTVTNPGHTGGSNMAVAVLGDVNGDGYDDIAVGTYYLTSSSDTAGVVYVFHGASTGPSDSAATTLSGAAGDYLGMTVAAAGDVNGDGYDDVVSGGCDTTCPTGQVYLYLGSSSGVGTTVATTIPGSRHDQLGSDFERAGDIDGDGRDDLIIAASEGANSKLFLGTSTGLAATPTTTWSVGGSAVAIGDFDGDGYADLAVGYSKASSKQGAVYTYHGSAGAIGTSKWTTLNGEATNNYFGDALVAGDFDGDGYADLAVGAYGYDSNRGRVYVYDGSSAGLSASPSVYFTGDSATAVFGGTLSAAGDVNGDGFDDLLLDSSTEVEVHQGSATGLSSSASMSVSGYYSNFGDSLSGAGDVNGDGFDDVLIGDWQEARLHLGYDTDTDGDGSADSVDCDPSDASVFPGAAEACNGVDDDCDGAVDDGVSTTSYPDLDGDGFGDPAAVSTACSVPSGYVLLGADCDDGNAAISPAAAEVCDAVDNDCDGDVDELGVLDGDPYYFDSDGDGYGGSTTVSACSLPAGYSAAGDDCDDAEPGRNPGATEACNGVDDDCDGGVDEGGAAGESTWYLDADGDGEGSATSATVGCDAPIGYTANASDCDDTDAGVNSVATERCNGTDDDCDGSTDEGVLDTFYEDLDGDGVGGGTLRMACSAPAGYVGATGDCDDSNATAWPGAAEVCDGADNDCDGSADEAVKSTYFVDADGDGYGSSSSTVDACDVPAGYSELATDCDDSAATVNPAAVEVCDALDTDEDCDGLAEDADPDAIGQSVWYTDADLDGFGSTSALAACDTPPGYVATGGDCDDGDAAVSPAAAEVAGDGADENCDGEEVCFADGDGDGYRDTSTLASADSDCDDAGEALGAAGWDCDDADEGVHAGLAEVVGNGVDEDCDGAELCYGDGDGDGFRDADAAPVVSVDADCDDAGEAGIDTPDGDCDDSDPTYHPGAEEANCLDSNDYNCDGSSGYTDADGDGAPACEDCDDQRTATHPGASELCNDRDDDCDGATDEDAVDASRWYADADGDGYSDPNLSVVACSAPPGYLLAAEPDCDDSRADVHPGASDTPGDGADQDCDGSDAPSHVVDGDEASGCGCESDGSSSALPWLLAGFLTVATRGPRRKREG